MKDVMNPKIKGWMAENGYTRQSLAKALDIPIGTFKYRMDGRTEWKLSEIRALLKFTGKTFEELF